MNSRLAPKGDQLVADKLTYWRERLLEHDKGLTNQLMTRQELINNLDHWLDVKWAIEHGDKAPA